MPLHNISIVNKLLKLISAEFSVTYLSKYKSSRWKELFNDKKLFIKPTFVLNVLAKLEKLDFSEREVCERIFVDNKYKWKAKYIAMDFNYKSFK